MIELDAEEIDQPLEESPDPPVKMGRPRKYAEGEKYPRYGEENKVNTKSILKEIQRVRDANPTKKDREIHTLFLESKRDWIIAKLFDTAENGDTPTIRFNAQARLKDELDGRVATQDKRDPDEDNAIGKILLPEEM